MEGLELACFEIPSCYINAIHKAKEGDYEEAKKLIEEGNKMYAEGHKARGNDRRKKLLENL